MKKLQAADTHALRLHPGDDIRQELLRYVVTHQLAAVAIVTCVGSLTQAMLRFADQPSGALLQGKREIVSLVGTLSALGGCHLHMSLSDGEGNTVGGHLLNGSTVYTTAEVVLLALRHLQFVRRPDAQTGYEELVIEPASK